MINDKRPSRTFYSANTVRASISVPPDLYVTLEEIAQQKKVSLAWVVRDAAEKYVAEGSAGTPRIFTGLGARVLRYPPAAGWLGFSVALAGSGCL